jgi:S-adenosylmethionine synthetase
MSRTYVSEFVLPGHPDKLCDAIADALVQEACKREKRALCGVEVAIHRASVFITGRIACKDAESIPIDRIARDVLRSAGYGKEWQPDPDNLRVEADLCLGPLDDGESDFRVVSDDQSIITGYAIDLPGTNFLPPEHWLAYRLSGALQGLRLKQPALLLGPDGKVTVIYEQDTARSCVVSFSASLQQKVNGPAIELHRAVLSVLKDELAAIATAIPGFDPAVPDDVHVNGAGNFGVGGPEGDNGLSGKKLVVDAYGPRVPIGGGALSGKDFYKADRAGAILARRLAKLTVMTGAMRECTATLAFLPGVRQARLVSLRNDLGEYLDCTRWSAISDRSLETIGDAYTGMHQLIDVARYGHFTQPEFVWEQLAQTYSRAKELADAKAFANEVVRKHQQAKEECLKAHCGLTSEEFDEMAEAFGF